MEEKERYYYDDLGEDIYDRKTDRYPSNEAICHILNNQIERIKNLEQENQQLKLAQKQLAIEALKGLRDKICDIGYDEDYNTDYFEVMKEIDNQIKELKGEE